MLAEAASATTNRSEIIAALQQASAQTGSNFDYLLGTAMRESSLKTQAKSTTSSASGLFQFVGQTWLGLVKQYGARYGLGSYAGAIQQDSDGRYVVDNAADHQAILALRNDPKVAALMEGEYANESRSTLESSLGRQVCNGELYAAHFLGPEAACRLIRMSQSQPATCAASEFPSAANANKSVFYKTDGTPKSVREVYDWAVKQPTSAQASDFQPSKAAPRANNLAARTDIDFASSSDNSAAMQLYAAMGGSGLNSISSIARMPLSNGDDVDLLSALKMPAAGTHGAHKLQ
jgi:hypothetical protein